MLTDALEVARRPVERRVAVLAKGHARFFWSFATCAHVRLFST